MKHTIRLLLTGILLGPVAVAHADSIMTTIFTVGPGNNGNPANVWTVSADGTNAEVAGGNSDTVPTTGNLLDGASGTFAWTWTAEDGGDDGGGLGGRLDWDETTFTGVPGNGWAYDGGGDTFGPNTPLDTGINTVPGEAIRMVFDLSGLTLLPGQSLQLDNLHLQNDSNGNGRVSYLDSSASSIIQLTGTDPGQIAPAIGSDVFQTVNQIVDDGDEIALWRTAGGGQLRLRGFQFSVIPEPSTVVVFGLGTLVLLIARRKRRK